MSARAPRPPLGYRSRVRRATARHGSASTAAYRTSSTFRADASWRQPCRKQASTGRRDAGDHRRKIAVWFARPIGSRRRARDRARPRGCGGNGRGPLRRRRQRRRRATRLCNGREPRDAVSDRRRILGIGRAYTLDAGTFTLTPVPEPESGGAISAVMLAILRLVRGSRAGARSTTGGALARARANLGEKGDGPRFGHVEDRPLSP